LNILKIFENLAPSHPERGTGNLLKRKSLKKYLIEGSKAGQS